MLVREVALDLYPRAQVKNIDLGVEDTGWPLLIDGNPVELRENDRQPDGQRHQIHPW